MTKHQKELLFYLDKLIGANKAEMEKIVDTIVEINVVKNIVASQTHILPVENIDFVYDSFMSKVCPYCKKKEEWSKWKKILSVPVVRLTKPIYEKTLHKCLWLVEILVCPNCSKLSTDATRDVNWEMDCDVPDDEVFIKQVYCSCGGEAVGVISCGIAHRYVCKDCAKKAEKEGLSVDYNNWRLKR